MSKTCAFTAVGLTLPLLAACGLAPRPSTGPGSGGGGANSGKVKIPINVPIQDGPKADLPASIRVAEALAPEIGSSEVVHDADIGRISLIGAGMKTHPGVAATMFETLAAENVNIEMISTSSIRISCVVRATEVERGVRALHKAFELADGGPQVP